MIHRAVGRGMKNMALDLFSERTAGDSSRRKISTDEDLHFSASLLRHLSAWMVHPYCESC
jgi:hypothetical protein